MTLKILIKLDFNHQQPRSLKHILGLQNFYLGSILLEPFDSSIDVNRHALPLNASERNLYQVNNTLKLTLKTTFETIKVYIIVWNRVFKSLLYGWPLSEFFLQYSPFFLSSFFFPPLFPSFFSLFLLLGFFFFLCFLNGMFDYTSALLTPKWRRGWLIREEN